MLDEIECISNLRNGSYKAFQLVYDEYADRLYSFVLRQLRNRTLAQDIVQDTFMRLWLNRKQLNCFGNLQGFIYAIAKYRIIDHFRQQMAQVEFMEFVGQCNASQTDISPEDIMLYDEFLERLAAAKAKLTPRERQVYELKRERYMSVAEISAHLGISEQTVKNHLTTSLRTLRKELSGLALVFVFWL